MKTDSEIQQNVIDEFNWEPILNAILIGVAARNGVFTLSGFVNVCAKKFAARK